MRNPATRRRFIAGMGAATLTPVLAWGQEAKPQLGSPPTVISNPPRQWGPGAPPEIYPDPDILVLDDSFAPLRVGLAAIHRLWTGSEWAEGPAWSGEGRYIVFSDVKGDTQYRYIWETGRVSAYRKPSYNTNGNSFDFPGPPAVSAGFLPPRRAVGA